MHFDALATWSRMGLACFLQSEGQLLGNISDFLTDSINTTRLNIIASMRFL